VVAKKEKKNKEKKRTLCGDTMSMNVHSLKTTKILSKQALAKKKKKKKKKKAKKFIWDFKKIFLLEAAIRK
jgi:hypothetical protein